MLKGIFHASEVVQARRLGVPGVVEVHDLLERLEVAVVPKGLHIALGHPQVDAGSFGPEPRIAVVCDGIGTPGDDAHQHGRAAIGDVDGVATDVRVGEERAHSGGKGAHQNAPFSRTRPIRSVAPPATAQRHG